MKEKTSQKGDSVPLPPFKNPWTKNTNSIWLASSIKIYRNIDKFAFPGKLPLERRKQIVSLVGKSLMSSSTLSHPVLIKADEIGPQDKEYLYEHFLATQSFLQAQAGEAFVTDDTGEFLAIINLRDHIQLQLTDCQGDLEKSLSRLINIENTLGKTITYSFSPKFGFLTANPSTCGTGCQTYVYLHLPGLIHSGLLEQSLNKHVDEGIVTTGLHDDPNELVGDILTIHNNFTLGLTEENLISAVRTVATKIMVDEKRARSQIQSENNSTVKDKVSRAYGLLAHSYQVDAVEAMNAISLLKLGLEVGWISGISPAKLNELYFNCRRAHLLSQMEHAVDQEELSHHRAELIHKSLKKTHLETE